MEPLLKFVIPVRHPENSRDWSELKRNLAATIKSVAAQSNERWHAVIVANRGSDLPHLPPGFSVVWTDFPPNLMHDHHAGDRETFLDAVRLDKGRRILAGMLETPAAEYTMVLDDDDFVARDLTAFVARNRGQNGWFFRDGYIWREGGMFLLGYPDFSRLCGSSHIIRTDLYDLPESQECASDTYIKRMLGSHIFPCLALADAGTPLAALPFPGAVYRVGHIGAHSRSTGIWSAHFFRKEFLKRPWEILRRMARLRILTPGMRHTFFGSSPSHAPHLDQSPVDLAIGRELT